MGFNFLSQDWKPTANDNTRINALPQYGVINSIEPSTRGLWFSLMPYTINNSLRLSSSLNQGTLSTKTILQSIKAFYVLATSGNGTSTINFTVRFADNTTQTFNNITVPDWYGGTDQPIAFKEFGRVERSQNKYENPSDNPRLYQLYFELSESNYNKGISSFEFTRTGGSNAGSILHIMAITTMNPLTIPITKTDVTTYGGSDGTATATPSGGTPPYTYSWKTNPIQTTATATGLTAGSYEVTVTDAKKLSLTNNITVSQPPKPHIPIRYVKSGGTGDGYSWDNASGDLQAMIQDANADTEIWVAAGTYKPNRPANNLTNIDPTNRDNAFVLKSNVKIYGGFPATASGAAGMETRNWNTNKTILSGDLDNSNSISDGDAYHVVLSVETYTPPSSTAPVLDGFTITGGNANGNGAWSIGSNPFIRIIYRGNGGGLYTSYSSPRLTNIAIVGNKANIGGGMYNDGSYSVLTNCSISGNEASTDGGGMSNTSSSPRLYNVTLSGNYANEIGGGMSNFNNSKPKVYNSIVLGNNSGVANDNATNDVPEYKNSLVQGLIATDNGNISSAGINASDIFVKHVLATVGNPTTAGDYSLKSTATAVINKGDNSLNTTTVDLAGNPRVAGSAIDLGAFEVQPQSQTITADDITKSYGDADFTHGSASSGLPLSYSSANTAVATIVDGKIHIVGAGTSTITASQAGDANYLPATQKTFELTVTQRPITVTAVAKTKVFGDASPALTYSVSESGITFTGAISRDAGENVGKYPIKQATLSAGANYNITFVGAVFEITPKPITVTADAKSKRIGTEDPVLTYSVSEADVTFTGSLSREIGENAGIYAINQGTLSAGANYTVTFVKANFEITLNLNPDANGIVYVKKGSTGDGSSWSNALGELADALKYAKQNESTWTATNPLKIFVAKGTYKPLYSPADYNFGNDAGRSNSFLLVNNVQLYGGFAGTEATLAERDLSITANKVTLSGDLGIANDNTDNVYRVVLSIGKSETEIISKETVLDGFTISDGNANAEDGITINETGIESLYGGGMLNIYSDLTLTNLTFSGNNATFGGGMFNYFSSPTLIDVKLSGNTAYENGGGMYNQESSPTLSNVTLSGNTATQFGGGMLNFYSSPRLTDVTLSENIAPVGGGMVNERSSPKLNNVSLAGNTASYGGGMLNMDASPILTNVTISGNIADEIGGGMYNFNSSPTLTNVILSGNTATQFGGGMANVSSSPTLTNVTISGNNATQNGGGMVNGSSSKPKLYNSIILGNGSGVYNEDATNDVPEYKNSLEQTGDQTTGGNFFDNTGTSTAASNSAPTDIFVNHVLATAGNPTTAGNFALKPAALVINAGNNNTLNTTVIDLAGNLRVSNGTIDLGAYEYAANVMSNPLATSAQTIRYNHTKDSTSYYSNSIQGLVAKLVSRGSAPVQGSVSAKVWIDATQNPQFVKRHYEITPDSNAATATGNITLYFTQSDFDAFNAVNTNKLPAHANDATGKANLLIEKRGGKSSDGSGSFGSYSGTIENITPATVWNAAQNRWEVNFDVTGFSGFFVKSQSGTLPVQLVDFTAGYTNGFAQLQWQSGVENNFAHYEVEKSTDAVQFVKAGSIAAKGSNSSYALNVAQPEATAWYRLKLTDKNGSFVYSEVKQVTGNTVAQTGLKVYPNPVVNGTVYIESPTESRAHIYNASGSLVKTITLQKGRNTVSVSGIASGVYFIKTSNGEQARILVQ